MSTAIEKVLEIAASNSFDNASVQTCLTAVTDLSNNMDTRMQTKVDAIIDSAPGALNTLNELAAALGDDANFATTVTNSLSQKQASITATTDLTLNDISGNDAKFSDISGVNFFTTGGTFIGNLTGNATTATSATSATIATSATTAGTVTTAAQPNITSVGTLTSLNVNGDISGNYINIVKGINLSFSKDDLSYNQLITHSNAVLNDRMGRNPYSISTSGNYLAMGAIGANSNGTNDTGAIIVFKKNANGVWTQLTDASGGRLEPFTAAYTSFGYKVSINGDYLVGSSRNYSTETTSYTGAIVIYKNTNGTWAKIPDASGGLITATTENSRMGHNLNMYGDFLAVYNDGPDADAKKKIYIYKNTNGTWALSQTIDKTSVATSTVGRQVLQFYKDEWLIFDGATSKILYVYKNNNGTWEQNTTISDTNKSYYGNKSEIYDGYIALGSNNLSEDIEIWKYDSGTTWNKIQTISNPFTHTGGSYRLRFNKKYLTLISTNTSYSDDRETKIYENKNDTYELIETIYGTGLTEYGYNAHLNDSSELFIYTSGDPYNSGEILYYTLDQASDFIFDGSGLNGSNTIFNSKVVMTDDLSGNDASFNNVDIQSLTTSTSLTLPVKSTAGAPSTTPATGTLVFNSNDNKLYIYNGGWRYVDTTAV